MSESGYASWLGSFLSTHSERHAAIIGFVVAFSLGMQGLVAIVTVALVIGGADKLKNKKAVRELRQEPWYGIGAAFLGFVVRELELMQILAGLF